jgi:dTDP-4-dehydrorhamnose reductase
MRILVTGVTGQVGGALVSRLSGLGTIIPLDEITFDFTKLEAISDILSNNGPDLIINPAAYTAVDSAEDEPELAMRINGEAPAFIARWAADHDVPLIHFSTDYVYDGGGNGAWREDDKPCPLSVYGATKLAGDNAVRSSGAAFLIIRTCWVYAAQGKNFLRTICRLAQERKELHIVDDQIGSPTSAAVIADVVSHILFHGIDKLREHALEANGVIHVAGSGETSWHGFAAAIVKGLKSRGVGLAVERVVPIQTDQYPTRAKRPRNSRLDLTRLQTVFGIEPPHWRQSLALELDKLATEIVSRDG